MTLSGPDGLSGTFTPQSGSSTAFDTPKEFKADLVKTDDGYRLTWHESGERWYYGSGGALQKKVDRNDNATTYDYDSAGNPSKIVSTKGTDGVRTLIVHTDAGTGLITSVEQDAGSSRRVVAYGYDGNRLVTLTDATGRITRFGYTGEDLTKITGGAQGSGSVTDIAYDGEHRVTAVTSIRMGRSRM